MSQNRKQRLDDGTTAIGIILGFVAGMIYALLHIRHRGTTTRKNLTQFGAGSIELDIDSSLDDAKQQAHQRLNQADQDPST